MNQRKYLVAAAVSFLILLVCVPSFCVAAGERQELKPQEIAELYRDTVVIVETTIRLANGSEGTLGGSGFFIPGGAGLVATNCHVVRQPNDEVRFSGGSIPVAEYEYWVVMPRKGRKYKAELFSWDKYRDVALLKVLEIAPGDYKMAKLGNSDKLAVGQSAYAIGAPYGLEDTFNAGVISALHRHIDLWFVEDFIQMDTPINPGNSGSPLINVYGEVVGINDAGAGDGLNFAIAINFVDFARLRKGGEVKIGYLGTDLMLDDFPRSGASDPGFADLKYLNEKTGIDNLDSLVALAKLTRENQALVLAVALNSPAEKAGLKKGDIVTSFNNAEVKSGRYVRLQMFKTEPDKEFEIKVLRVENGKSQEVILKATLEKEAPKDANLVF